MDLSIYRLGWLLLLTACTPVLPNLGGGTTTPPGRTELVAGGVSSSSTSATYPILIGRHGFSRIFDLGLVAAPNAARIDPRLVFKLYSDPDLRLNLVSSLSPYGGAFRLKNVASDQTLDIRRIGAELPVLLNLDVGGIYEVWAGPRLGAEYVDGSVKGATKSSVQGFGPFIGGVVGLGVGFRRVHILVELSVRYVHWEDNAHTTFAAQARKLDWAPAFGLRVRM